jgi:hypothetical protein
MEKLSYRPDCFDHIRIGSFYEVSDENGVYAYCALEYNPIPHNANIHMEVLRFGPQVLKTMKTRFISDLRSLCKKNGIKKLVARKQGEDSRWPKLIAQLGFSEPITIKMSYLDV